MKGKIPPAGADLSRASRTPPVDYPKAEQRPKNVEDKLLYTYRDARAFLWYGVVIGILIVCVLGSVVML